MTRATPPSRHLAHKLTQREAAHKARMRARHPRRGRTKPRAVAPGSVVRKDADEIAFEALLRRELRRLRRLAARRIATGTSDTVPILTQAEAGHAEPASEIGLHWGESPVDLPAWDDPAEARGLPWAIGVLTLSSALLLLFNSFAIGKWAGEQPVTQTNGAFLAQARAYHAHLQSWGLDLPLESARRVWRAGKALSWADLGLGANEDGDEGDVASSSQSIPMGDTTATP